MGFGDLKSKAGLEALDKFLADRSYIEGHTRIGHFPGRIVVTHILSVRRRKSEYISGSRALAPYPGNTRRHILLPDIDNVHMINGRSLFQASQADAVVFQALSGAPGKEFVNALRWYNHISSYGSGKSGLPGVAKDVGSYGPASAPTQKPADDDEDSDDLFGDSDSDDEEEDEELKAKLAAYNAKKAKKPTVIAKSSIILDVKPWDDETDMADVEKVVRSVETDGLLWGASKLVPVGYGIKKLQINCVVEDDKVGTDYLEESITAFEDLVQSVDVVAFNKI